jgi:hypothetical protein
MNTAVVLQYSKLWSDLKFFSERARATSPAHFSYIAAHFSPPLFSHVENLATTSPDSAPTQGATNRRAACPSSPASTGAPPARRLDPPLVVRPRLPQAHRLPAISICHPPAVSIRRLWEPGLEGRPHHPSSSDDVVILGRCRRPRFQGRQKRYAS